MLTHFFDSVLQLMDATCGTAIACDDDGGNTPTFSSLITRTNVAAGTYAIVVDSYGTPGAFNLNVRGTVANGTACDTPLFTAGVLACTAPATCQQGTCQ